MDIKKIADKADMIIIGYAFTVKDDVIEVINLNNTESVAILNKNGNFIETTMQDSELVIVKEYYLNNKEYLEVKDA